MYFNKKFILLIVFIILHTSCVHREDYFLEKIFRVELSKEYILRSKSCEIIVRDSSLNTITYDLNFHPVHGGETLFLGFIPIRSSNGYKNERVFIELKEKRIQGIAIHDLKEINEDVVDINRLFNLKTRSKN